jgi:hypothetical protein
MAQGRIFHSPGIFMEFNSVRWYLDGRIKNLDSMLLESKILNEDWVPDEKYTQAGYFTHRPTRVNAEGRLELKILMISYKGIQFIEKIADLIE